VSVRFFRAASALETENEIENAKGKIQKKLRFDRFKPLRDDGAGFGESTNKVTFIDKNFNIEPMELKSKEAVADDILNK
jgi:phosphopantothenoylcysteine decarboxylase/phosphopantothenate--cysteine ligase